MMDKAAQRSSFFPKLTLPEWVVFCVLASVMAAINIYSTLLIGWGDGGSIIAVIASVMVLGLMGKRASIQTLNVAQTLVSAGGSVGFAVASYAAVHIVDPSFDPNPWVLGLMFASMGLCGTVIGASVRKTMVKYYFPSGTACAVIAKTIVGEGRERDRPVWMLKIFGLLSTLIAIPTKISLTRGGASLINDAQLTLASVKGTLLGLSVDPLLYGIGLVVGPRIGIGLVLGASAPMLMTHFLEAGALPSSEHSLWIRWAAIAVLTLPTFAAILFAWLYRQPAAVPAGFSPGAAEFKKPLRQNTIYIVALILGLLVIALTAQALFELSFPVVVLTVAISWPLCIINGRVTGDTDINPVRLVAIVLLSVFAMIVAKDAVLLLGIAVIGSTLAGIAVDMMQDYRTGHLLSCDPTHQTSVQFVGVLFGVLAAIPFFFLIKSRMGFGEGTSLPAPGVQIWATIAESFTGQSPFGSGLMIMVALVSIVFTALAFFSVWPKSAKLIPSIFGIGIGIILGFQFSLAIFIGGAIRWLTLKFYAKGKEGEDEIKALARGSNDSTLAGAAIFAASALVSVVLLIATEALNALGYQWWYLGH